MAKTRLPLLVASLAIGLPLAATPTWAAPVVCTTAFEAPTSPAAGPQEVTRCGVVQSVPALVEQRFFTYTAPFAEGVSIRGQLRDLFGIATGSINSGNSINAFGFPDQTIVWDGTALQNTTAVLLEAQSDLLPWRTADISNGFNGSLGASPAAATTRTPVRGAW